MNHEVKEFKLRHYKGFNESKIDFDGRTTIFFGPNEVGKSSVLEAISSIFAPLFSGIINKGSDKKEERLAIEKIYALENAIENTVDWFGKIYKIFKNGL